MWARFEIEYAHGMRRDAENMNDRDQEIERKFGWHKDDTMKKNIENPCLC